MKISEGKAKTLAVSVRRLLRVKILIIDAVLEQGSDFAYLSSHSFLSMKTLGKLW